MSLPVRQTTVPPRPASWGIASVFRIPAVAAPNERVAVRRLSNATKMRLKAERVRVIQTSDSASRRYFVATNSAVSIPLHVPLGPDHSFPTIPSRVRCCICRKLDLPQFETFTAPMAVFGGQVPAFTRQGGASGGRNGNSAPHCGKAKSCPTPPPPKSAPRERTHSSG